MTKYVDLLKDFNNKSDNKVLCIFPYGSRVYGTANEDSDEDYITVLKKMHRKHQIYSNNGKSFVIHDTTSFQRAIWAHEPFALEAIFLPVEQHLKNTVKWDFELKLHILRESFSQKASHSFVKAKKKFEVEADFKRGKKSLFHSCRILNFGIQIAQAGKISNYQSANEYWWDIYKNPSTDWDTYQDKYKPIFNNLNSKFRELAPKNK